MAQPVEFTAHRFPPSEIKTVCTFKCSAPGCFSKKEHVCLGTYIEMPLPPEGWQVIGHGAYLCNKHEWTTYLDGKLWTKNGVKVKNAVA